MEIKANENQNLEVAYQVSKDIFTHKYDYIALYEVKNNLKYNCVFKKKSKCDFLKAQF
jgi:hypothetical protein